MTDLLQIENIKLVVLFVLITAVIAMSHFGVATRPARPKTRRSAKPAPAAL
jgi:hypothetical protein